MNGWNLTFTGWPWWAVLPLAALAVWTMVLWQRGELSHLPEARRRALLLIRGLALGLIVLLLLEPTLSRTANVRELPLVGILVDESGSMSLDDRLAPPSVRLEEAVALGLVPATARPMVSPANQAASDADALAKAMRDPLLAQELGKWEKLSRRERAHLLIQRQAAAAFEGKARLQLFGFDQEIRTFDPARPASDSRATNFEAPLSELSRRWSRDHIGAVVLLSDGRQTAGQDPSPVIASLRARGATVSGLHFGDTQAQPDAAIAEVTGSHEAFRDEVIGFDVTYRVVRAGSSKWDLVVSQEGKEVQRRPVSPDGSWQIEHFETPASTPGTSLYQVRIEPAKTPGNDEPNFDSVKVNNQSDFAVNVNQDPIRVFLADTTPRWESRYLAAMFERDKRVKFERTYHSILSKQAGAKFLPATQAEWDANDLIVLGDIDPRLFTAEQQKMCADYVSKRGGFLVCVAGPRGMPRGFNLGPLAAILPVRPIVGDAGDDAPVSLALTDQGRLHPITSVMRDASFNERLWPALPPLQWIASGVAAKPGATVLLQAQNRVRTPIVAIQPYGAGRVLWMGTEESWRWRDRLGDRIHQTFWLQTMRWGLAARLRGQDTRLQASLDRPLVSAGETAQFRARVVSADGQAASTPPRLTLEQLDGQGLAVAGSQRQVAMTAIPDSEGMWQADLRGLPQGRWRAKVSSDDPAFANLSEQRDFQVRDRPGREFLELAADPASLARLAEQGGGYSGGPGQAEEIFKRIAATLRPLDKAETTTNSLWDNYLILVLILSLLIGEWAWRKRLGLP